MRTPVISDGSLAGELPAIPALELPAPDLFARRAARLVALANGHAMEGYLKFGAALCLAQQRVLDAGIGGDSRERSKVLAGGSLSHQHEALLDLPSWHAHLAALLEAMPDSSLPDAARTTLESLRGMPAVRLRAAAADIMAGQYDRLGPGEMPFIAAGLQVHWQSLVQHTPAPKIPSEENCLCPACGSAPQASLVRIGGPWQGLRYLSCSLCATQWHYTRVKCGTCASTKGINYLAIEGGSGAAKAETCDSCGTYTKIFYMDKDTDLEVGADDLATLALDFAVDEAGYQRTGPNLLLQPG